MSHDIAFTNNNIDDYLKALAKEYRKLSGKKMPAEIIIVGGASTLINYGFRENTYDIDAIIQSSSAMKDAISNISNSMDLKPSWINSDFIKTNSYSPKLIQYSRYYKTFSNIVQFRTVTGEYLIAMKLMSARQFKNDLSDIVGIIKENQPAIKLENIKRASEELYENYDNLPAYSRNFIEELYSKSDLKNAYEETRQKEINNKKLLMDFDDSYPDVLNEANVDDVLEKLNKKK